MHVWNLLHAARWKYRTQKIGKKSPSGHHRTTLSGYIFATEAYIDNQKMCLNSNICSTCPRNIVNVGPLTTEISVREFGAPSKFQQVSCLGFLTAPTLLNGGQPHFARCLTVSWAGTLYIHFWGSCPLTEFCQLQNSLCVQLVLRSLILAALLHGTRVVGVSQTLLRWAEGATYIRLGGHHVWHRTTF